VFKDIKTSIRADRPAFLMAFLRNFYNYDVTGGKLVSERVLEDNWNVAAGASAIGTVACVDCWIEDFRKDVAKNNVPTPILHGDANRILPPDAISRAKMIKNVNFVELPGGPHAYCGRTPTGSIRSQCAFSLDLRREIRDRKALIGGRLTRLRPQRGIQATPTAIRQVSTQPCRSKLIRGPFPLARGAHSP
jgi:hypothetical protein